MINSEQLQELSKKYPAIAAIGPKVAGIIQEELKSVEEVRFAESATVRGVPGLVCVTADTVLAFWTQKMFVFFKFPAQQAFQINQMQKAEKNGAQVHLRAEADPGNPDDGYEDGTFVFESAAKATELCDLLQ